MGRRIICTASVVAAATVTLSGCMANSTSYETTGSVTNPARHGTGYAISRRSQLESAMLTFGNDRLQAISVSQTTYPNGRTQRIVFAADPRITGENMAEIHAISGEQVDSSKTALSLHSSSGAALSRAIPAAIKGTDLSRQAVYSNGYGAYGMVHRLMTNKIGCMFAWQTVRAANTERETDFMKRLATRLDGKNGKAALSYRIRYCEPGLSANDARQIMQAMQIDITPDRIREADNKEWFAGSMPTGFSNGSASDLNYRSHSDLSAVDEPEEVLTGQPLVITPKSATSARPPSGPKKTKEKPVQARKTPEATAIVPMPPKIAAKSTIQEPLPVPEKVSTLSSPRVPLPGEVVSSDERED